MSLEWCPGHGPFPVPLARCMLERHFLYLLPTCSCPCPALPCPMANSRTLATRGRLAESRCPRPSASLSDPTARDWPSVPQPGARPSTPLSPEDPRVQTRAMVSSKCHGTNSLRKSMIAPPATEPAQPGPWAGRGGCTGTTIAQEGGSALDVAETLWWVAVSIGRKNLGIDLASSPRQADGGAIMLSTGVSTGRV